MAPGRRPALLWSFRAICVATSVALAGQLARADTIRLHYSLSLIGLPLGMADARATVDGRRYSIEIAARLTGIAALVSSAKGAAKASGLILQGRVAPSAYATVSADSRMKRTVRMALTGGDVDKVEIDPPIHDDNPAGRVPVTPRDKRDIVDPVSALVMTMPSGAPLVGPAACDRTLPVFDGYTRFDIRLAFVSTRPVKIPGFDGQVSVCRARYVPIAGHRPNRPATKFMENNRQIEVWLAPLAKDRLELPLRISVATMVGTTVAQATDLKLRSGVGKQR